MIRTVDQGRSYHTVNATRNVMYSLLTPGYLHLSEETLQLGIVFLISDLHDVRGIISVRHRPKPKFFTGSHFWKLDSRFQCLKKVKDKD